MSKKGGLLSKAEKKLFLNESLDYMKNTQERMMNENGFGKETNRYIFFPERNRFYMYDEKTNDVFFEARFQVIGTYAKKSETWRWGWSNRYVPNDLQKTALKIMEFGKVGGLKMLSMPKIRGENLGLLFTSIGMYLSKPKGYYKIPGAQGYPDVYIIFTKINKVTRKYDEIIKNDKNNKEAKSSKYKRVITKTLKKQKKKDEKTKKKPTKKETKKKKKEPKKKTSPIRKIISKRVRPVLSTSGSMVNKMKSIFAKR